jgi:hypothetical protein
MQPTKLETLNLAPHISEMLGILVQGRLHVQETTEYVCLFRTYSSPSPKLDSQAGSNLDAVLSFRFEVPDRSLLAATGENESSALSVVVSGSSMRDSDHFQAVLWSGGRRHRVLTTSPSMGYALRGIAGESTEPGLPAIPGLQPMGVTISLLFSPFFPPHHRSPRKTTRLSFESTILNIHIDKQAKTDRNPPSPPRSLLQERLVCSGYLQPATGRQPVRRKCASREIALQTDIAEP